MDKIIIHNIYTSCKLHNNLNFREGQIPQSVTMHTGVKLDNLQCIAYRPAEKWKASPEFVRLLIISANSSVKKKKFSSTVIGDKA